MPPLLSEIEPSDGRLKKIFVCIGACGRSLCPSLWSASAVFEVGQLRATLLALLGIRAPLSGLMCLRGSLRPQSGSIPVGIPVLPPLDRA